MFRVLFHRKALWSVYSPSDLDPSLSAVHLAAQSRLPGAERLMSPTGSTASHPVLPQIGRFRRISLLDNATPIQRLERLERALTTETSPPRIYVKRDDVMSIGGGGNKLRKLEFLMGEALQQGCDTFITTGGRQSNHARLTAAVSARTGLRCELVLADLVPRRDEAYLHNGNVLLDGLFGARVHHVPGTADALAFAHERASALEREGRRVYVVGAGGSSPIGCLGGAACSLEIAQQERELGERFIRIVMANGSSGTHAGLAAGLAAINADPRRLQSFTVLAPLGQALATTTDLAQRTFALLDSDRCFDASIIRIASDQRGEGYGIPTDAMLEAVRLLARSEGLLLDPVYSGKAFAGLLAAIRAGEFKRDEAVLFIMTGGTPGLFAYEPVFRDAVASPSSLASDREREP
jgi:L-cysteate sulfo-lyase